ncbi:hypothetical protein [Bacillus sp. AFS055030]|uniref:hypothetical protein n=1 Tax=Bacillus sp. AFS055030 TaxID=2033507 RepID=UPI000BFE80FB|nr:hypothetical protein [Bacillus sp. AFS055030]PGL72598.1 hypothetical protein CN925_04390 [Bacillus sp. AFS055030]
MKLKIVFLSFISVGLIIYLFIMFFLPNTDAKSKIKVNEISKKLNSNQTILIPTGFGVKNVFLIDDGVLSPYIDVQLSHDINVSIYSSSDIDYEGGRKVRNRIVNNLNIREYQTKDHRVIYLFKDGKLNYLYEFDETYRKRIDEYLLKEI